MTGLVVGDESDLVADLEAIAGRLEFAQSPQYPLNGVRVAARLQISRIDGGWRVLTEKLELQHENTHLRISGTLTGSIAGGATVARAQGVRASEIDGAVGRAQGVRAREIGVRAGAVSTIGVPADGVPEISAHAELTGADVPFLEKLAGHGMVQALGRPFRI